MSDVNLVKIDGFENKLLAHNKKIFPSFLTQLLEIKSFKIRPNDVFVIAYPKSGTTWTEEIVWLIQNNLDFEKALSVSHTERVVFLDEEPLNKSDQVDSPRVFKSHLTLDYLPENIETKSKLIYVMRNPKDMLVSYFHFVKWIKRFSFTAEFEIIVDQFLNNKIIYGNWCEHVNQFFENSNVLFITYEDLLESPYDTTKKIVSFLGKEFTDDQIYKLLDFTSFKKMKKNSSFCFQETRTINEQSQLDLFFRKGKIGDWLNYFNEDMSSKLDQKIKLELNSKIQIKYYPSN